MTISELKKLPGTKKQRDRLWDLYIREKKITFKQYREIKAIWDKNQKDYQESFSSDLVQDAVNSLGDNITEINENT